MRKIINGKLFDSATAELLGRWNAKNFPVDLLFVEELYRTNTGAFFLRSLYGYIDSDGERLEPLAEAEARQWAEKRLLADDYIKIFGEVPSA